MTATAPDSFIALSSALTGFTEETLVFAQQNADFYSKFMAAFGADTLGQLIESYQTQIQSGSTPQQTAAVILEGELAEAAKALIVFWYLGQIGTAQNPNDLHIPSADFFAQGLAWRAVQAHAPAVSTQDFGYWATPPAPLSDYL